MTVQPLGVTGADLDEYLTASSATMVAYAEAEVRAYCGWHIAPSITETVTVAGLGGDTLLLPTLHLTDVTVIEQDGIAEDLTDITFTRWGQVKHPSAWGMDLIDVTFTHGYDEVPADIKAIVLALAARTQGSPDGRQERQVGQITYQFSKDDGGSGLSPSEKSRLARYRLPVVA